MHVEFPSRQIQFKQILNAGKSNLIGWRQGLTTSPANHVPFFAYRLTFSGPHVQQAKTRDLRWILKINHFKNMLEIFLLIQDSPIMLSVPFARSRQYSSMSSRPPRNLRRHRALSRVELAIFHSTTAQHRH